MDSKYLVWAFRVVVLIASLPCFGASTMWNGTWKLNISKSSIPGPNFLVAVSPTGEYRVKNEISDFTFRCDGKEYSRAPKRTISCTRSGASAIDTTTKENGNTVASAHWELFANGRTLTIKSSEFQPATIVKSQVKVYVRTSAGVGFAGAWTDTHRLESAPLLVLKLSGNKLHMAFPPKDQYVDLTIDGSDAPVHGSKVPEGATLAARTNGPQEIVWHKKLRGKIINKGKMTISKDGRMLTEQYWIPTTPEQKAVLVYEKQ